jgi:hypothetical protein
VHDDGWIVVAAQFYVQILSHVREHVIDPVVQDSVLRRSWAPKDDRLDNVPRDDAPVTFPSLGVDHGSVRAIGVTGGENLNAETLLDHDLAFPRRRLACPRKD